MESFCFYCKFVLVDHLVFQNPALAIAKPLFLTTCKNLSIDKIVNQTNMDYNPRSFKKSPLRAKNLKIRHILDDRDDITIVTQFITAPAQLSYL